MFRFLPFRGLIVAMCLLPLVAQASPFDMKIFGDSLSDTGNMFALSMGGIPPSPPYAERFSNGPIWVDHLARDVGARPINDVFETFSLSPGINNFAAGGAYAASYDIPTLVGPLPSQNANDRFSPSGFPVFPGLQGQVETYGALLSLGGMTAEGWHVVWAGANDLVFADVNGSDAVAVAPGAVAAVRTALEQLIAFGATEFLVPNLPDIGLSPFGIFSGRTVELSTGTVLYNDLLALALADLEATFGVDIVLLDTYSLFAGISAEILVDPIAAGFPGGFGPCLVGFVVDCPTPGVDDPNDYFFWDGLHPTSSTHRLLTEAIKDAKGIPAPGTLILVALGLTGLRLRRRRT